MDHHADIDIEIISLTNNDSEGSIEDDVETFNEDQDQIEDSLFTALPCTLPHLQSLINDHFQHNNTNHTTNDIQQPQQQQQQQQFRPTLHFLQRIIEVGASQDVIRYFIDLYFSIRIPSIKLQLNLQDILLTASRSFDFATINYMFHKHQQLFNSVHLIDEWRIMIKRLVVLLYTRLLSLGTLSDSTFFTTHTIDMLFTLGLDRNYKDHGSSKNLLHLSTNHFTIAQHLIQQHHVDIHDLDNRQNSTLQAAIKSRNVELVKLLVDLNVNINHSGRESTIETALNNYQFEIVQYLLQQKIDIPTKSYKNYGSLLHYAVDQGLFDLVKELVENQYYDINIRDISSNTPFILLPQSKLLINSYQIDDNNDTSDSFQNVVNQIIEIGDYLLQHNAAPNIYSFCRASPLHYACEFNNVQLVEYFLNKCGNINSLDDDSNTPLIYAIRRGCYDTVQFLLHNGANIRIKTSNGHTPLHYVHSFHTSAKQMVQLLVSQNADVNAQSTAGTTPLISACIKGSFTTATVLLEHNADPNITDDQLLSPLFHLMNSQFNAHLRDDDPLFQNCIKQLIQHKAHIEIPATTFPHNTPLLHAVKCGYQHAASILIDSKADISTYNDFEQTALHIAASFDLLSPLRDTLQTVQLLVEHGAPLDVIDLQDNSPLLCAAKGQNWKCCQYLIEQGSMVDAMNTSGCVSLHYATLANNQEIVKLLLEHDAFVNVADIDGHTPLYNSIFCNCQQEVPNYTNTKRLLESGADPLLDVNYELLFKKDTRSATILHIMIGNCKNVSEVLELLLDAIVNISLK